VDVCDTVMDKMGYPRGLIRYTTENALEGKPSRILRPRVLIYGSLLARLPRHSSSPYCCAFRWTLTLSATATPCYRETNEGLVENVYTLRILNMDNTAHTYQLTAEGIEGLRMQGDGRASNYRIRTGARAGGALAGRSGEPQGTQQPHPFRVQAEDSTKLVATEEARFLGPVIR